VSIILPVYNAAEYLPEALDGIFAQAFPDFEVLAIDDCSTDESLSILRSVRDPRFRVAANPTNLGAYATCNVAIQMARGRLVANHDADDVSHPERLARQVGWLDRHPDIALVGTNAEVIDGQGRVLDVNRCNLEPSAINWALHLKNPITHSTICARREALLGVGLYDEQFVIAGDYDLFHRMVRSGYRIANLPEYLVRYRVHPQGGSQRRPAHLTTEAGAIAKAAVRYHLPEESDEAITGFVHAYLFKSARSLREQVAAHRLLIRLLRHFLSRERPSPTARRQIYRWTLGRSAVVLGAHLSGAARPFLRRLFRRGRRAFRGDQW